MPNVDLDALEAAKIAAMFSGQLKQVDSMTQSPVSHGRRASNMIDPERIYREHAQANARQRQAQQEPPAAPPPLAAPLPPPNIGDEAPDLASILIPMPAQTQSHIQPQGPAHALPAPVRPVAYFLPEDVVELLRQALTLYIDIATRSLPPRTTPDTQAEQE